VREIREEITSRKEGEQCFALLLQAFWLCRFLLSSLSAAASADRFVERESVAGVVRIMAGSADAMGDGRNVVMGR
jgi:hypothetical protein